MRKQFFFEATLVIMLAVMLILSSPRSGLCADCSTTTISEFWSNASSWDCGHVPGSSDTASIVGDLTVDIDVTVVSLSLDFNSNLIFGNHTITLSGIQPITNGYLAPDNKFTIILSDADHYVSPGTFYNLILAAPDRSPHDHILWRQYRRLGRQFSERHRCDQESQF